MVSGAIGCELIVEQFDRATLRLRPPWVFYAAVAAAVVLPMLAVATLSGFAGESPGGAAAVLRDLKTGSGAVALLGIVVVPLIETTILWAVVASVTALARNSDLAIVLAAAILVLLHRPGGVGGAITIAWPFLAWGAVLLSRRYGKRVHAFVAVWCLHAAQNALLISIIFALGDR